MTKEEFASVFVPVIQYYGKKDISEMTIQLYFQVFADIDFQIFKVAMTRIIKTKTFFPKISEISEILNGNETDAKSIAWEFVISHLENATKMTDNVNAPKGVHSTIKRMGGWMRAGQWRLDELAFIKKDFFELFTSDDTQPLISWNINELLKLKEI